MGLESPGGSGVIPRGPRNDIASQTDLLLQPSFSFLLSPHNEAGGETRFKVAENVKLFTTVTGLIIVVFSNNGAEKQNY